MTYTNTWDACIGINGACGSYLGAEAVSNGCVFVIWSRFRLFWVLEAARDKTKETTVGIKVTYAIYKHFRNVFGACGAIYSRFKRFQLFFRDFELISLILGPEGR